MHVVSAWLRFKPRTSGWLNVTGMSAYNGSFSPHFPSLSCSVCGYSHKVNLSHGWGHIKTFLPSLSFQDCFSASSSCATLGQAMPSLFATHFLHTDIKMGGTGAEAAKWIRFTGALCPQLAMLPEIQAQVGVRCPVTGPGGSQVPCNRPWWEAGAL